MVLIYEGYVALRDAQAGWNAFAVFQATRCAREESDFVSMVIRLYGAQDPQWRELYEWVLGAEQKTVPKQANGQKCS